MIKRVTNYFDYSEALLAIDALKLKMHRNFLEKKIEDNLPLIDELLVQSALIRTWIICTKNETDND
jgi:hypothetical protein